MLDCPQTYTTKLLDAKTGRLRQKSMLVSTLVFPEQLTCPRVPTPPNQHDGEERQRCGQRTMSNALFLRTYGFNMRPARGAVPVTQDPPSTPAAKKKIEKKKVGMRRVTSHHSTPSRKSDRETHLTDCALTPTSTESTPVEVGGKQRISQIAFLT